MHGEAKIDSIYITVRLFLKTRIFRHLCKKKDSIYITVKLFLKMGIPRIGLTTYLLKCVALPGLTFVDAKLGNCLKILGKTTPTVNLKSFLQRSAQFFVF